MKSALWLLIGIVVGANAVYAFRLVAMILQRCGGI